MATQRKAVSTPPSAAADAIDQQLARYRAMRDFTVTSEPNGAKQAKNRARKRPESRRLTLPFVIQKHAASHLHYDFRLGWNGVFKSWAVAKGPSYFPGDKRLAVQVEDHPLEYGGFEGIIPKGQYGGGTVMLWDMGEWEPQPSSSDVDKGLLAGSLKFTLRGTKMLGKWVLVRMGGEAARERKPNWLLIKEHDGFEHSQGQRSVTEAEPNSIVTGRTLEQIALQSDHVWNSNQTTADKAWTRSDQQAAIKQSSVSGNSRSARTKKAVIDKRDIHSSVSTGLRAIPKEQLPAFIAPELAMQSTAPPKGEGWIHELKLDGYRIQARIEGTRVQLLTRTALDWTHRMRPLADAIQHLPAQDAILDGEVVVLADDGTTSFSDLQASFQEGIEKVITY